MLGSHSAMTRNSAQAYISVDDSESIEVRDSRPGESPVLWTTPVALTGQPEFEAIGNPDGVEARDTTSLLPSQPEPPEWPPPPPVQREKSLWKIWRRECRANWRERLAIWHVWALESRALKLWCLRTNFLALALQPLTIGLVVLSPYNYTLRLRNGMDIHLSRFYVIDFAISALVLFTELLYWCFLYLPILREAADEVGSVLVMSPFATLLTEVVASLDFWILVFAMVELVKHGISITIPDTHTSWLMIVRHSIVCGAFLIIFLKYYSRGRRDLQAASNLVDSQSMRRDEQEDCTGYWDYYARQS